MKNDNASASVGGRDSKNFGAFPFACPRGLSRVEAARYVGIGVSTFDKLVADKRMPNPISIGARKVWDSRLLDLAFYALQDGAEDANDFDEGGQ